MTIASKLTCSWVLFLACVGTLSAQTDCRNILNQAEAAYSKGNLDDALQKLQDAETCDYKNVLQKERQGLQNRIFGAIKQQKNEAETAKQNAVKQTRRVFANDIVNKLANENLNRTVVFRLAEYANKIDPENYKILEILFELFYGMNGQNQGWSIWRGKRNVKDLGTISPDGSKIARPVVGYSVEVFNTNSELILFSLPRQEGLITALTFSSDGSKIVSRSGEKTVKFWDSNNGRLLFTLTLSCFEGDIFFMSGLPERLFCGEDSTSFGSSFWIHSDSLISEMNSYFSDIGYLTPEEIDLYNLEESFEFAGVYIEMESLLKEGKGNEQWLFSIADYFLLKARQLKGNPALSKPYFENAIKIYEALEKVALEYPSKTYRERAETAKKERNE